MIDQALYTHSKRTGGWGVVTCTSEVDLDLEELIRVRGNYRLPNPALVSGEVPSRSDDEVTLPRTLRLITSGPVVSLSQVSPVGRELSGTGVRGGNVLAHMCFAPTAGGLRAGSKARPIQFVDSPSLLVAEPDDPTFHPLDVLKPGPSITEDSASAFLAGAAYGEAAADLVAAVLRAHWSPDDTCRSVCVVGEDVAEVIGWLSVVAFWMPVGLSWQISFDSFSCRPDPAVGAERGPSDRTFSVSLTGTTADLLERGAPGPGVATFNFTTGVFPTVAPTPLAALLAALPFAEVRPLLRTIDVLADRSSVPEDEAGWLTLYHAAILLLGDSVSHQCQPAITDWMVDHADTLGKVRVESLAFALDRNLLNVDQVLAVMSAGSAVGSQSVVKAFEEEAFEQAFEQAVDRTASALKVLPISWSDDLVARATIKINRELERAPADLSFRLLDLAAGMSVAIPDPVLVGIGHDLVGLLIRQASSFPLLADQYRPALALGVLDLLEHEPLPVSDIWPLQDGLGASGLLTELLTFDPATHPLAAVQLRLPGLADDAARLRTLQELTDTAGHLNEPVLNKILACLWPSGAITTPVLAAVVGQFQAPLQSYWVCDEVSRLVDACQDLEELRTLDVIVEAGQLQADVGNRALLRLKPLAAIRDAAGASGWRQGQLVKDAMTSISRATAWVAVPTAKELGMLVPNLSVEDAISVFVQAQQTTMYGSKSVRNALVAGVLIGVNTMGQPAPEVGVDVVARLAPGMLQIHQSDALVEVCRSLVSKWDGDRIQQVASVINQTQSPKVVSDWHDWAAANVRRRFLGR